MSQKIVDLLVSRRPLQAVISYVCDWISVCLGKLNSPLGKLNSPLLPATAEPADY